MPDAPYADDLQWATITDFSPGIRSRSREVLAGHAIPAPLGSAQVTNTFRCISLPTGGLAPLPAIDKVFDLPLPVADAGTSLGYFNIDGFFAFGPVGPPAASASGIVDDLFVIIEYLDSAGTHRVATYYRIDLITITPTVDTLKSISSTQNPTAEQYRASSFTVDRMNPTSPYLTPGTPVVVADWSPPGFAADQHIWAFPAPNAPSVTAAVDIASAMAGRVLGHQGRILVFQDVTNAFGANSGDEIPTNEQLNFSDPANSYNTASPTSTIGTQQEVFMQEYPNGYGAFGSIAAGELFLVKNQGGGLIASGDIANPTITRLAGVTSTGGVGSIAASTPTGLVYYSRNNGVWSWNGADSSTKISDFLEDDFVHYPNGPDVVISFSYQLQEWGDWILATNGYLYDTNSSAWWRLDDPSTYVPQWYSRSFFAESMYAVPMRINNTTKVGAVRRYNRLKPAHSFSWQGHPIPVSLERVIDVTQVVLLAQGAGTITVTLTNLDGTSQTETFTITNASQPQRLRLATYAQGYNLVPSIVSTGSGGSGSAPIVHSVGWGYSVTQDAVAT
ncbi:MAG TPA: hypothetical protein VNV87_04430 [Acidimicrobiales bacterium]|jgi:hypothetical protein|nr:hypothetical protein [Acidimicrobiales bacterium]